MTLGWINGTEFCGGVPALRADDLGLQRGYAAFEFLRCEGFRPFHPRDHLTRLAESAEQLGIRCPLSREEIQALCASLAVRSGINSPGIRILLTGGYSLLPDADRHPNLIVIAEPLPAIPAEKYASGIVLATTPYQRELATAKTNNYMNEFRLEAWKRQQGADDLLYISGSDVTECPRSNFFAVINGRLVTPKDNVLHGVTRRLVLEAANALGIPVQQRILHASELPDCSEAFITSTTKRILPVKQIDSTRLGKSGSGEVTATIRNWYSEYVHRGAWEM